MRFVALGDYTDAGHWANSINIKEAHCLQKVFGDIHMCIWAVDLICTKLELLEFHELQQQYSHADIFINSYETNGWCFRLLLAFSFSAKLRKANFITSIFQADGSKLTVLLCHRFVIVQFLQKKSGLTDHNR